ncbi:MULTISPECIES: N-succinylarginine dihydrolase [Sphingomonas]|jgi:succinylarginine dihydrolase|uniref:N-succinylarginine dihydrolase n=1 Tax=Sphingomonas hankookensis TaxID=563996 RepID=A0ABR5YGX3_9SPHN|nr:MULTISPECIES: N-succinylarginine dihydrolase [Sphingomonas]KZE18670.1 succinylarginine dihydrolase [Sphingomonas hankookensis]PZT94897.1 MAG: N-succinylarginine dihydrolase [Sphingomonas sp.]RSV33624.1 N-succinylarginine dihydrolase [Sphingomonas sp. ABOLH]WCP70559.1 N-succinylarginine dihydrolase [Sphingomonas hankookensis]
MSVREINFDGIIGPSHNYAGLSHGNLAATRNAGETSRPRAAALQGIAKMRANLALGLTQGILLPHPRPDHGWLAKLATDYAGAPPHLRAQALSASAMWAANAATVSPANDCGDGRCHLTVANLVTMPHRSHEWPQTLAQLRIAFADPAFAVHGPVPAPFGDEGAANHMRLCETHGAQGVEVFVYGVSGGPFPARQHREASEAIARAHGLDPARTLLARQSDAAIAAGAFHNDVVAVANERVLFAHEQAFEDRDRFFADLRAAMPSVEIIEVPADRVSLADAITSYLFNAQLVTLPDGGGMVLILPSEARDNERVWTWLQEMVAGNGPIRRLEVVDVRESMANGGGPACLRLRVVADPATVDPRFLVDDAKLDRIAAVVEAHWPERIAPADIGDPALIEAIEAAHRALLESLDLVGLIDN